MAFPPPPPAGACHTGTPPASVRTFPFTPEEFSSEPRTPAAVFVTMPAELRGVTVSEPLETVRPFEAVSRLLTPSVPAIVVLPVAALTLNLFVFTARSLVTPRVPAIVVLPVAAVTLNLFVFTARSLVTPRVPAIVVLPVAAVTLNLFVFTARSLVTPRVPAIVVLPLAAVTWNLPVLTFTSPAIAVLPVSAVTTNLEAPTVRSPVTPRVCAIVAAPWMAVVRPDWLRLTLAAVVAPMWITEVLPVPFSMKKVPASGPEILPAGLTENLEAPLSGRWMQLPL